MNIILNLLSGAIYGAVVHLVNYKFNCGFWSLFAFGYGTYIFFAVFNGLSKILENIQVDEEKRASKIAAKKIKKAAKKLQGKNKY